MRNISLRAIATACVGVLLCHGVLAAGELKLPASSTSPRELVIAALRTELDGPTAQRDALLKQALSQDPDFAPARWQLGFVRWDDQWMTLEEVAKRASSDKRLAAYRKRRDRMIDTADAHRELAVWCRKHGLPDEARVHWAKVLEFNPQDAEALTALGLELYNGRLLTKEQIAEAKKQAGERMRAMKHWQPQLVKWRDAIARGGKARDEALEAVGQLSDPKMIPALETVFAQNGDGARADELNLLLIEIVGRIPFPKATQVLLRRAIVPDSRRVREAACDELKKRPMHAYVPQLIAALPGKIKTKFHVYVLPGGMVLHEHEVFLEGRQADMTLTYDSIANPTDSATAMLLTPLAAGKEFQAAGAIEARATIMHNRLEWLRNRVRFALERTTGFINGDDPQLWEKQYDQYYDISAPPQRKRSYQQHVERIQVAFQAPLHTQHTVTPTYMDPTIHHSCFAAGTPVLTLYGPRPIEQVEIGDRVLVMDVDTGELRLQPVQARTLGPAAPMVKVTAGETTLSATRGHPFWVNGEGWVLAKHLNIGQSLHGMHGPVLIGAVEESLPREAYNLVVGDAGTYFVGQNNLLVHDITPLRETVPVVPGLRLQATSP